MTERRSRGPRSRRGSRGKGDEKLPNSCPLRPRIAIYTATRRPALGEIIPILILIRSSGDFFWLPAPTPIVPMGTLSPAGFTDVQEWIRDTVPAPGWLPVGTEWVEEARADFQPPLPLSREPARPAPRPLA